MLNEYDCVRLRHPLSEGDVPAGSSGVVVKVFTSPRAIYEVEFFDSSGTSLGNFMVEEGDIEEL